MNESVAIGPLVLKNPVMVASGTFGYGDELCDIIDAGLLGAVITKSLSLKPRDGNPPPRIWETASGMLNSIGLANIGVMRFIDEKLPLLAKLNCTIIANIAGGSAEEYTAVLDLLEDHDAIAGYEINVSCPNVKEGGLNFGTDPKKVAQITKMLRQKTAKCLILKLTPNVAHISEFARAAESEGADAVSVINTLIGMAVDIRSRTPRLSTITGGLSGPAIKPVALAKVFEASRSVKIPVIGIGGIAAWEDAVEFMIAGASAVQIGTSNFIDPAVSVSVISGIKKFCEEQGLDNVNALTGSLITENNVSVIQSWL